MKAASAIVTLALLVVSAPAQTSVPPAISAPAPAQTPVEAAIPAGADSTPAGKHTRLKYSVPKNAATGARLDGYGGSRDDGVKLPSLYVLAPNHTGLTTHEQPALFWFQSGPAATRLELTVVEPKKAKPILKVGVDQADRPGIHRLSLSKFNISLAPGISYNWSIALHPDAADHSHDIVASGTIQRTAPDPQMTAALANAQGLDKAAIYAGKGLWYDALEAVSDEINASPKNKELRLERAALLDQAGLKDAAASDRK